MQMTAAEICASFRQARNQNKQLRVLAELNGENQITIIKILAENGECIPPRAYGKLFKRLDKLDAEIAEREKEYREIVKIMIGKASGDAETEE